MSRPKAKWSSDVSGRAASSSDTSSVLVPAKKRKTDSGVLQPTDFRVRILFADAGDICSRLEESLIRDERVRLKTDDLLDTAVLCECEIIIGSDFPAEKPPNSSHMTGEIRHTRGIHATSWHIWYDEEAWSVRGFRSVPMTDKHSRMRDRECAMLHLCHDRGYEIAVMFVKVLKGKQAAAHSLQLNYKERQEVVDIAFRFLAKPRDCPVIVAGDLGVGLSTVHNYIRSGALQDKVQTHCIKSQSFHTLFHSAKPGYRCTSIDTRSQRMIAYQIEINSGDPHPTAIVIHRSMPVALTPRQKVHMKILQQLADGAASTLPDSDDAHHTVELLYQPIAEQTCDEHGVVHTSAIDVDVSGNTFVCAILLLKKIRADVGAKTDGKTLTNVQFEEGLQNLKTIFETNFLLNRKLADDLRRKKDDPSALTREEKKQINTEFRGAFSVWLRSLLGDKAFVFALLRHGIFDFSDLRRCAQALREGSSDDGGVSQSARHTPNPQLRRAAVSARRQEKDAKKYAMWLSQGWTLSSWQRKQIMLLETGVLAQQVRSANAAYGFGKGAEEPLTREGAMMLKAFTNEVVDNFFK